MLSDDTIALKDADRLILCTGKVYYDLIEAREQKQLNNAAIMRIEQLYPLSADELLASIDGLPAGKTIYWVQEEPTNMGAWPYFKLSFSDELTKSTNSNESHESNLRAQALVAWLRTRSNKLN